MCSHHTVLYSCNFGAVDARAGGEAARDAAAREHAVDVDSEERMPSWAVRPCAACWMRAASQLTFGDLSEDSDDE